jgi:hypothetical protein
LLRHPPELPVDAALQLQAAEVQDPHFTGRLPQLVVIEHPDFPRDGTAQLRPYE